MSGFQFRLERVLRWRRQQREVHRGQLQRLVSRLNHIDREAQSLTEARSASKMQLQKCREASGDELNHLATFERFVQVRHSQICGFKEKLRVQIQQQQSIVLEVERKVKMLESLRSLRLLEWESQQDKVLEDAAYESFLSSLSRKTRGAALGKRAILGGPTYKDPDPGAIASQ